MTDLFKDYIPAIMISKKSPFSTNVEIDQYYEKTGYVINRVLSMYQDCLVQANLVNLNSMVMSGVMKHDFFMNTIRGYKRPFHYVKKPVSSEDIELIKDHYSVNEVVAHDYAKLLSNDDINEIKKERQEGGKL